MPKRGKQFFRSGPPQVVSWPLIGSALPEGGGAPAGFGYLRLNGNRLLLNGKPLMMRYN